ncbi:DNA repair metallo-beta-lactamase protein, putative [Plasmodium knowlesi strain H]|uniref:DNA repair metallo-beta-lactamase protein, putative n=3 Tax=Plasmodium knowlesi TaxID=5850 RepID=A0A5K1UVB6_PLAKH|nr:DNA repair metallo-beta-lactamase protein, putative [Plasmodium knowlesi strain H]OTN65725.1 putative DNA repair metallo-beta-lactamase protein [Plasmodium knowlesi]CAA9989771.1 DNA repair metallo-beta-lactamase protein, putative [Plasmodium knowlesi strain H]SBO22946.1 DNA repair metallo-beta-lactamase protein, putative [Plasmodium knowlesi strain H]SBO22950.1 DNA repair metallo-beta-lactamase protein, putative [Plasmodium knowlesi strain H]VVS79245.1 DNA repair metallo-beta-lactamase prot|eukprot:XP_002260494.1 DNA repair metallo-beta-lactamase, putative [Plasmodium knowlesi strain H]
MVEDNIHVIQNDPLIIVDKFPYTRKKDRVTDEEEEKKKKITKIYFLTHFHADHYTNINKYFHENVFSSTITKKLLTNIIGVNEKYIHNLKINKNYHVFNFEVIFIDANHCPGSVIIYFEFANGTKIIHTGDFRYSNVHTFLIKKVLSSKRNEQNGKQKLEKLSPTKSEEQIIKGELSTEMKTNFSWKGNQYNIHFSSEHLNIYKRKTYIVNFEEFRIAYLKNVEDLIWGLKNVRKEFYFYDSIEKENYFNFFIYVDLSLYFNQNEVDILLFHDGNKRLNENVIINEDNVKNIRFVSISDEDRLEDGTSPQDTESSVLTKRELLHHFSDKCPLNLNRGNGVKCDRTNGENGKVKKEEDIDVKESRFTYEHTIEEKKTVIKEKKEIDSNLIKLEYVKGGKEISTPCEVKESEEDSNYIRTIYLDTTYALSKNNLFAPQMYLINFIIYICKKKVRENFAQAVGVTVKKGGKHKTNLARTGKRTRAHKYKENAWGGKKVGRTNDDEKNGITTHGAEKSEVNEVGNRDEKESGGEGTPAKKTLFMFGTYNLGKEKIYLSVSEACNMKIHFRNEKKKTIIQSFLHNKNILNRITDNKLEAQIHIVDINYSYIFPKIEKEKFKNLIDEEIEKEFDSFYYIIPTGWVKKYSFYQNKEISIFLIPYSEHSNLSELENFVKSIKPCNIIPTVFYNPKEKTRILNMFNSCLNLQREVMNFLKISDERCLVRNKKISKRSEKTNHERKQIVGGNIGGGKNSNDSSQSKLTSFFPLIKRKKG